MFSFSLLVLFASTSGAIENSVVTNETEQLHLNTVVKAQVIKRIPPKYPRLAAHSGKEGWVQLSFVVKPDGSTSNIIVEDSSNKIFEKAALRSIKEWQYSPAKMDGKAIQQCLNKVLLDFRLSNTPKAASKKFVKQFRWVTRYLKENNIVEVQKIMAKIQDNGRWNAYEDMYYEILNSLLAEKTKDTKAELNALKRVLGHHKLQKESQYSAHAVRAFSLAIELQRYDDAKSIFENLKTHYFDNPNVANLTPYYEQMIEYLVSDEPLVVNGAIGSRDFWRYKVERNGFVIDNVKGNLTNLDVRCDNYYSQFRVEAGNMWLIPQSWGDCSVYIFGDEDTTFTIADVHGKQGI